MCLVEINSEGSSLRITSCYLEVKMCVQYACRGSPLAMIPRVSIQRCLQVTKMYSMTVLWGPWCKFYFSLTLRN